MPHIYESVKPKPIRYETILQLVRAVDVILAKESPDASDWDYLRRTHISARKELMRNQGLGELIRTE